MIVSRSCIVYIIAALAIALVPQAVVADANKPFESGIVPKSTDGGNFVHALALHPRPGMPGTIAVSSKDLSAKVHSIRLLLNFDGNLLTVPLKYSASSKSYRGTFPTPRRSLDYQFQVVYRSGKTITSKPLSADPTCDDRLFEEFTADHASYPEQEKLLKQSQKYKRESETLEYLLDSIKNLTKE